MIHKKFCLWHILGLILVLLLIPFATSGKLSPEWEKDIFRFGQVKPITLPKISLPGDIQKEIELLARQEIKLQQANENLAGQNQTSSIQSQQSAVQSVFDTIKQALATDPSQKAKLELAQNDREISKLQNLLTKDKSDKAVDQAIQLIKSIGEQTDQIATDPKVQTDRSVLQLQIEQYNRLQLVLQRIEDTLPVDAYLKIEDARVKYLVSGAQASLNAAPNLDAVHNIAIKEVAKQVGNDFSELKAIEILTDIGSGLNPGAQQKLAGLQKELALQFEKRMLKAPPEVRNKKLQDYIKYSFGNPVNQIRSFNQMQNFLTDRDMILGTESLKELALKKLEDRLFQLTTPDLENQFNSKVLRDPADIKILILAQLDIESGKDQNKIKQIGQMSQRGQQSAVDIFGKDKNILTAAFPQNQNPDLIDIIFVSRLSKVLTSSPQVSTDVKQVIADIKQKTVTNFVTNISKTTFSTKSKLTYNPVSPNADVRVLLPVPGAIATIEDLKRDTPQIAIAQRSTSGLIAEHLLQVNDPEVFEKYQDFIAASPQVKQIIQNNVGQSFFTNLALKRQTIAKQSKKDQQTLYERMQQITQSIFTTGNTSEEKKLPQEAQKAIVDLKNQIPQNSIPKLETPEGVTLPEIAKLPDDVANAIVTAAKDQIKNQRRSQDIKLDLSIEAKDLGVSEPSILPDSPLYSIVEVVRTIQLVTTIDPVQRAQILLKQDNEKTLEAAKLIEESQSQTSIGLALKTLESVNQDFNKLKQNTDKIEELKKTQTAKVDQLVDQIIQNGVARQTVFAKVEDKVHGDQYVAVEKTRSHILAEGVATLLKLTDGNVQKLTDKLQAVVQNGQGSQLKDIRAVELLTEIARTQPQASQQIIKKAESNLAQNLETKLLEMPAGQRTQAVLDYAKSEPGNPIRQFEAADTLKDGFTKVETKLLAEAIKDTAVQNLEEKISEIADANSRQEFVDTVVGDKPQDLKIVTEIAIRVDTPQTAVTVPTPIQEKVDEIKATVLENIIDTYKDKPQDLAQTQLFQDANAKTNVPDIIDVKTTQDLVAALTRSPDVAPAVIDLAQKTEDKVINQFVDAASTISATQVTAKTVDILQPVPEIIAQLIDLKTQVPAQSAKIDVAISAEVNLLEQHIATQVNDAATLQTDVAQIQENPVVAQVVAQVGGQEFAKAIDQKSQAVTATAVQEQAQLQTTVQKVEQEIFSTTGTSKVEQTLPALVQQEIQQIKQEVPQEQIPQVKVEAAVTVSTPQPTPSAPTPSQPSAPAPAAPSAPAPAAPAPTESKPPEQSAPAAPAPAAPAAPGL